MHVIMECVHVQTSCVALYNTLCVSLCYEWPTSVRIKIGKGFITEQVYLYHIIVIHYNYVQAVWSHVMLQADVDAPAVNASIGACG